MGRPFTFTATHVEGGVLEGSWPITAPFGEMRGSALFPYAHQGVDVGVWEGTPLFAPYSGVVGYITRVGDGNALTPTYGNSVWLDLDDGGCVFVAHLSTIEVEVGQRVPEGHRLGRSGNTGQSTGPHVHIQATTGDHSVALLQAVDPLAFLTLLAARGMAPHVPEQPAPPRRSPALQKAITARNLAHRLVDEDALDGDALDGMQAVVGLLDAVVSDLEAQEA